MFRLTLRNPSPIPLDLNGVIPERLATLSADEVARLPLLYGNRREQLGEFFAVATGSQSELRISGDTQNVHAIGAGMTTGSVVVEGRAGRHSGAGLIGGTLVLESGAGDWVGAEMRGGFIDVRGAAGHCAGAAYRGSRFGMRGGTILLRSGAGDETGLRMRRGLIVVRGPVGEFAGASMIAGSLFLLDHSGHRLGTGMKRGTIVTLGDSEPPPPGFRFACEYRPAMLGVYLRRLAQLEPGFFDRIRVERFRCYRGDAASGGRGEILAAIRR